MRDHSQPRLTPTIPPSRGGARGRVVTGAHGRYRVGNVIGEGGAAYVYAASRVDGGIPEGWVALDDEPFAVKVLKAEASADPELRARFEREVRVLGKVQHTGVCTLVDLGTMNGVPFYVQERLRGETLLDRLRRIGSITVPDALVIFDQLLETLTDIHRAEVIHRDVKPSNVFLAADGRVVLLDFGIALDREGETSGARALPTDDLDRLTKPGTLIGTPAFMSPEQAEGLFEDIDGSSDVFSAALTVLTAIHGQRLRRSGPSWQELQDAANVAIPPLASFQMGLSPAVIEVFERAISFDKSARFPSARHARWALQDARDADHAIATRGSDATVVEVPSNDATVVELPTFAAPRLLAPAAGTAPPAEPRRVVVRRRPPPAEESVPGAAPSFAPGKFAGELPLPAFEALDAIEDGSAVEDDDDEQTRALPEPARPVFDAAREAPGPAVRPLPRPSIPPPHEVAGASRSSHRMVALGANAPQFDREEREAETVPLRPQSSRPPEAAIANPLPSSPLDRSVYIVWALAAVVVCVALVRELLH